MTWAPTRSSGRCGATTLAFLRRPMLLSVTRARGRARRGVNRRRRRGGAFPGPDGDRERPAAVPACAPTDGWVEFSPPRRARRLLRLPGRGTAADKRVGIPGRICSIRRCRDLLTPLQGVEMITKFQRSMLGSSNLTTWAVTASRRTSGAIERTADRGVRHRQGACAADGRSWLLLPLDGRAPLPARGVRGVPEPDPAQHLAGDPDDAAEARLRLQRSADVAPGPAGRGLCDGGHRDRGADISESGEATSRARWRRSERPARPGRQSRAVRGAAGRDPEGVRRGRVLEPSRQALHDRPGRPVPRLPAARSDLRAATDPQPVEVWQASERSDIERTDGEAGRQGDGHLND